MLVRPGALMTRWPTYKILILDSDGNRFDVRRSVLNSDGVRYSVPKEVRDSDGNSFEVT